MTQILWQVKVYDTDQESYTLYHFMLKVDVITSINTTWSRLPDSIVIENSGPVNGEIFVRARDTGKLLVHAEAISFEPLTQPTHF